MNIAELLSSVDSEIARLQEARALLAGQDGHSARRGKKPAKKHKMSAAGRAAIAAAQRKRWAKQKRAAKKAA
jgi:topoisomerase IA-like protein